MILIVAGRPAVGAGPGEVGGGRRPPRLLTDPHLQLVLQPPGPARAAGPLPGGERVLLTVGEQALLHRGHHLLRAGEEDEDEEALEGVEDEEDIPDVVNVQRPGDDPRDPGEAHEGGEPRVQVEVGLGAGGGDLGRGPGGLPHKVARHQEEDKVQEHDDAEGDDEVDDEGVLLGEPAEVDV